MQCPFCAEEIRDEAIKCRFCGESLALAPRVRAAADRPALQPVLQPSSRTPPPPVNPRNWFWRALILSIATLVVLGSALAILTYWAQHSLPSYFTNVRITGSVARLSGHYNYSNDFEKDARKLHEDLWILATRRPSVTHLYLTVLFYGADKYGNAETQDLGILEIADVNEIRKYRSLQAFLDEDRFKIEIVGFLMTSRNSPYRRF